MINMLSRSDKSLVARWWWSIDKPLFKKIILLMFVGILISITAPNYNNEKVVGITTSINKKYLLFVLLGITTFLFFSFLNIKWIKRIAIFGGLALIITLILMQFIGIEKKGAIRWIQIFGFSVQPTEFVKPIFATFSALLFSAQYKNLKIPGIAMSFGLFITFAILFIIQPDMGQTILLTAIWVGQLFVVGLSIQGVLYIMLLVIVGIITAYLFMPHFQSRIDSWIMPDKNDTYQVDKSLQSFADGGWLSFKWGSGTNKYKIPDANTDFIFAVIGEEGGILFCILLITLFTFIINAMLKQVRKQDDLFIMLAILGIAIQFALQTAINISSTIGLIPAKGMTLPLISAGGSSYIGISMGLGLIIALTRRRDIA